MSNKKVLILHGWGGSDSPHWQSQLASHIAQNYGCVSFPQIKDRDLPKRDEWIRETRDILDDFRPDTVVAHSLGCSLWFWLTQEGIKSIERLYLVAPPSMSCDIDELSSFFPLPIPTDIKAKEVTLVVSDNDKYISLDEAIELSKNIGARVKIIKGGGHINADSGFGRWEWIEREV